MKNLYILPFDHRSSFFKNILGVKGVPQKKDLDLAKKLKEIIFEGFLLSTKDLKNQSDFAILVDEKTGSKVLSKAKKEKIKICLPVEKSGQLFDFEYGKKFGEHIKKINPDFVKALIRYNPDNVLINKQQLEKIKQLSDFCKKENYPLLIELLVPPTKADLKKHGAKNYEQKIRAQKTIQAIDQIETVSRPSIWKLEGFSKSDWQKIIKHVDNRAQIIVLGRGEKDEHVKQWLKDAAQFKDIIGFAVGRTVFSESVKSYLAGEISEKESALWIAVKFSFFVNFWQAHKK
jgi:5-dehydro-2-deoxygluconokinase